MSDRPEEAPKPGDESSLIRHSLIWAAAMIATALQLAGEPAAQGVLMTLVACWFASFIVLRGTSREDAGKPCG